MQSFTLYFIIEKIEKRYTKIVLNITLVLSCGKIINYIPLYFWVNEKRLREVPLEDEVLGGVGEGLDHDEAHLEDDTDHDDDDTEAADLGVVGVVGEVHAAAELGGELHHVEQRLVLVEPQVVVGHRLQLRGRHFSRSMKSTHIICLKC